MHSDRRKSKISNFNKNQLPVKFFIYLKHTRLQAQKIYFKFEFIHE